MPRRRRYGRHYDGGGACGCCNYWNQDEEEVAQELIKEKAKKTCTGKILCCDCDRIYDRHNIKRMYIFAGIAFGLLLIITMGYSGNVYGPAKRLATFKKAECQVDFIVYNKNLTDRCRYTSGRNSGWREYKCLQIHVNFKPKEVTNSSLTEISAILAEEYGDLSVDKYGHQCTTRPSKCDRYNDIEYNVDKVYRYYKDNIGATPFKCLYDPENPLQVIKPVTFDVSHSRSIITLLAFLTIIFFVLLVFMCCTCGCQYVCAGRVIPYEIQQEVQKRRAENQGLTAGANPPAGGPNIYVGQPTQMVPVQPPAGLPPQQYPMGHAQPPPVGPQYGQYPPPAMAPQPGYPAPAPVSYPPPVQQPGQYPPQNPAYPPQGAPMVPPAYAPGPAAVGPPPSMAGPPAPTGAQGPPASAPPGGYQPPAYTGLNSQAPALPEKPPLE